MLAGIQKLTLLDYPGTVACTVFTAGCNLRCPYCHNASLVLPGREDGGLSEEEFLAFLQKRRGILDGVAVSGGEPLLHRELPELLEKIRSLGFKIKLDTNGSFPQRLREIVEAGLVDRVAMDIKSSPQGYPAAVGLPLPDLGAVIESADFLLRGSLPFEFRSTCVKGLHSLENFRRIAEWIAGAPEYYLQSFVNSGDLVSGDGLSAFSPQEMHEIADAVRPLVPSVKIRGTDL